MVRGLLGFILISEILVRIDCIGLIARVKRYFESLTHFFDFRIVIVYHGDSIVLHDLQEFLLFEDFIFLRRASFLHDELLADNVVSFEPLS